MFQYWPQTETVAGIPIWEGHSFSNWNPPDSALSNHLEDLLKYSKRAQLLNIGFHLSSSPRAERKTNVYNETPFLK